MRVSPSEMLLRARYPLREYQPMVLTRRRFLAVSGMGILSGCTNPARRSDGVTWGRQGRRFGEFLRPRAIGVCDEEVYVIDTTGRVQVFDESGTFLRHWVIPDTENGTPTAITFHPDGRVNASVGYAQHLTCYRAWRGHHTANGGHIRSRIFIKRSKPQPRVAAVLLSPSIPACR